MPGLGFLRKYGTVAASPANARKALDTGAALLVYPGGDYEVHRPTWEAARRSTSTAARASSGSRSSKDVPIVPVVSIGGQETALFLTRGEGLARLLRLDQLFRLKVLPISLALPWGLNVGDMLGHLPLPAKITIAACSSRSTCARSSATSPTWTRSTTEMLGRMQADARRRSSRDARLPVLG